MNLEEPVMKKLRFGIIALFAMALFAKNVCGVSVGDYLCNLS